MPLEEYEDVIILTLEGKDGKVYVSHGMGAESLTGVIFPQDEFHGGWGGSRWSTTLREWVIPSIPNQINRSE
jgi:hypothetical protein